MACPDPPERAEARGLARRLRCLGRDARTVGELGGRGPGEPEHVRPSRVLQPAPHLVADPRQIAEPRRHRADCPVVYSGEDECRNGHRRQDRARPRPRREQVIQRPHLESEEGKAEESDRRHLEDLHVLEERDGVDPLRPGRRIERLPQGAGAQPGRHEPGDPTPAPGRDVGEQRALRIRPIQHGLGDEPHRAPGEGMEVARERECRDERRPPEPGGAPEFLGTDRDGAPVQLSPHAEAVEHPFGEQHGRDDGRERQRDPRPALDGIHREEHVVPVLQSEVDGFEQEPDHRRPPQHGDERARLGQQRLAPEQHDQLVEDQEGRIPGEDIEPGGDRRDLVVTQHRGGDQYQRRRDDPGPG